MVSPEVSARLVPVSLPSVADSASKAAISVANVALLPVMLPVTVPPVLHGFEPVVTRFPVILSPDSWMPE